MGEQLAENSELSEETAAGCPTQRPAVAAAISIRFIALAGILALVAGCGSDGRLETYPVAGKVEWSSGDPFVGGGDSFIVFESISHGVTATGVIESDGTFEVGTYEPRDGAVAGKHRVSVSPPTPAGDPDKPRQAVPFPAKYRNLDTSGLEANVTPDGQNQVTLNLEKA